MLEEVGRRSAAAMDKKRNEDLEHLHHSISCRICQDEWVERRGRGLWRRIWEAITNGE